MSAKTSRPRIGLRLLIIAVVLVAAAVVGFEWFRPTALVVTVRRGMAVDVVTGSVVVHADKDLQDIKSELSGRVAWIDPRQLGTPFKKGEPIMRLDSSDLERQIKQAQEDFNAQVERARIQKEHDPALEIAKETLAAQQLRYKRGEISETDWKNAQRAYQQVETNLALADFDTKQRKIDFDNAQANLKRQLEKMTIRAPMDGIVQAIMVAPGELIGGGTTVATFFSNKRVVIAKIGEEDIGRVRLGQSAKVRLLNLGNKTFDAKVSAILPFADPDTQRYTVYLDVKADPKELIPFATGETTITVGEHPNVPLIPRRALFNDDDVYVVKDGVVEKRRISVGYKGLNFAEATAHLQPGEQVIVDDIDLFRDGEHVRVQPADTTNAD